MNKVIKIICLVILPYWSTGQKLLEWKFLSSEQADSLLKVFHSSSNDSVKMSTSRSLGFYYQEIRSDSALYFHEIQLQLAKKLKLKIWEAEADSQVGYILHLMGRYPESFEYFSLGKQILEDENNETKNWRPFTFSMAGNLHTSRLAVLAMLYNDLGNLYATVGDNALRRKSHLKAIEIATAINNPRILERSYANLASDPGLDTDSLFLCLEKSFYYAELSGFKKFTGINYGKMALAYERLGKQDSALKYYRTSVSANENANNKRSLVSSYYAISKHFILTNKLDSATKYAYMAFSTAVETAQERDMLTAYRALANVYREKQQIDSAFKYGELFSALNDSFQLSKIQNISEYQAVFFGEQLKLKKLEEEKKNYETKVRMVVLAGIIVVFIIIAIFLYRNNLQKQKANQEIELAYAQLKSTQSQLIQSEKMASLGELTAGIAHEIQNPLNFVNNFSEVSNEMIEEMNEELNNGEIEEAKAISANIKQNLAKITHHGKRADAIVKGMLQHSQRSSGKKVPTDINALSNEYLRLAYHGLKAKDKNFNATLNTDYDPAIGNINIIPQEFGRVILNLINNAFYAVDEKQKACQTSRPDAFGETVDSGYEPTVSVSTKKIGDKVEVSVKDNGNGISQKVLDKIFQPFFTTKPTGSGTGLGLSLSYDIVKAHSGEITVNSEENIGTEFKISLPI